MGILGLYNTLTSSVLERQREIGVWRAIGANAKQVSSVFWLEGLVLTGLAWMLCVIIGIPIAYGFMQLLSRWLFPIPFAFSGKLLLMVLIPMIIITISACFGPTARACRTCISEILRYE